MDWLKRSMGTRGGCNHFIEGDADDSGNKYLIIHSGSRNLGKQVADIYQKIAIERLYSDKQERAKLIEKLKDEGREKEIQSALAAFTFKHNNKPPKDLCYLEGQDRNNYLFDMRLCQKFAIKNREYIARRICIGMGWKFDDSFHTVHNYIDDNNIVRKGAISAKLNEIVLIPINMRDGCILGIGKGNEDWNYSAPHGAGRLMSRSKAKEELSLEEYQNTMSGVYTTSVDTSTLDEAPMAYKPIESIVENIKDTVEIIKILKPIYNFKASE
jgi:RNA-splicing ligase RtcB